MANQVVIEAYSGEDGVIRWRVVEGATEAKPALMQAKQGAMAGIFNEAMPVIGGGVVAAFTGAVADRLLGGFASGMGNLGRVVPRVGAALVINQFARKRWPDISKYAVAFLIYDAANKLMNLDGMAKGMGNQLAGGLPMLGGPTAAAPKPTSPTPARVADPLTAGWV